MKYITGKHTIIGLLAVALMLLTGCQSDGSADGIDAPRQEPTMEMQAYATTYKDAVPRASTRDDDWVPSGFTIYNGQDQIRVAFTQGNDIADGYKGDNPTGKKAEGIFSYKSGEGKWGASFYLPKVDINNPFYYLYGYMPAVGNMTLTSVSSDFANGATLSITELPIATTDDICVIVGVKKGVETSTGSGIYSGSGIKMGQFVYEIEGGQNHVYLLCDHLYAALGLKIRVNPTYHALRRIRLKKVWVKDYTINGVKYTSKARADVTLNENDDGISPIQEPILFTRYGSSSVTDMQSLLYKSANAKGLQLTTAYQAENILGYMAPIGMTEFTLVCQYDVYDTNVTTDHPDGNLIRENQTAENKINIKSIFGNEHTTFHKGTRYILQLTVNPTYLYMMSEPDLDNPTIEIVGGGS